MAKLYFRYGTVGSAKTLNLLAVAHNYRSQNKHILSMKPAIDTRFDPKCIVSRSGLKLEADYSLDDDTVFKYNGEPLKKKYSITAKVVSLDSTTKISCIVVDECQFLSSGVIDQLHLLTIIADIPVIVYGLKTNHKSQLFVGSKRILELADSIEEIKSTCFYCERKATQNLKHCKDKTILDGPEIEIGADEMYRATCKYCYQSRTGFVH
jgi:thymidine kinase